MDAALAAGLAGVLGLAVGRLWDARAESRRWRRDQRIRVYENLGAAYYLVREAFRALALLDRDGEAFPDGVGRALDIGVEWDKVVVAAWLHSSPPVTATLRDLDREVDMMFLVAKSQQFSWEEWRGRREPAERALETFLEAVRRELSLPRLAVTIRSSSLVGSLDRASPIERRSA